MKTKNLFSLILMMTIVASSLSVSCKSDDDGGGGGSAAAGTIVAKVDGSNVTTIEMTTIAHISSGSLQIQGNTGGTSSKAFMLTIVGLDGEGTYPIGGGANIFNVASYIETEVDLANPTNPNVVTWQAPYDDSQVGEINISELTDSNIQGTFHYKAKNADGNIKNITNGSFNISLQ